MDHHAGTEQAPEWEVKKITLELHGFKVYWYDTPDPFSLDNLLRVKRGLVDGEPFIGIPTKADHKHWAYFNHSGTLHEYDSRAWWHLKTHWDYISWEIIHELLNGP